MPVRTAIDLARFNIDLAWAFGEWSASILSRPVLHQLAAKGDPSQGVLTLPGFSGPEASLIPLVRFLRAQGFYAKSWGLGTNRGPSGQDYMKFLADLLAPRLKQMADKTGNKVSIVGQSLGGIYGRELARAYPNYVDRVITLGSPAYINPRKIGHLNKMVTVALQAVTGAPAELHLETAKLTKIYRPPPGIPLVSIYSQLDGVVSKHVTMIPHVDLMHDGPMPRENIEILGSHCGMGVNPVSLIAICDRLVADVEDWAPFNPQEYFCAPLHLAIPALYPKRVAPVA